jgi:hypothetical protein
MLSKSNMSNFKLRTDIESKIYVDINKFLTLT